MALNPGRAEQVVKETTTGPGTTVKDGSILADSLLISVAIDSITSGSLSVTVYNLTDSGDEVELMVFPTISGPTTEVYIRKLRLSAPNYRVKITYTGVCSYEIQAKAVTGSGEIAASILGSNTWSVGQTTIGTIPQILIPAAIIDRRGFIIRNYSANVIFVAPDIITATTVLGFPIPPGETLAVDLASGAEIYAVSSEAGADVRYAQAGG